jgi:hypothetical protein
VVEKEEEKKSLMDVICYFESKEMWIKDVKICILCMCRAREQHCRVSSFSF